MLSFPPLLTWGNNKKKSPQQRGLDSYLYQILLLLDFSLRLAPSGRFSWLKTTKPTGVAVTSQILCISITLNKGYYDFSFVIQF